MKFFSILLIALALFQLNCRDRVREAEAAKKFSEWETNGIAKVKVDEKGAIYLNTKPVTLDELGNEFARIKKLNGAVWYYRLSQTQAAEASGLAITKKVVEYRLPVKLCATNDPCRKDFE